MKTGVIETIHTEKAPPAFGPFSQGVKYGELIVTSGALPLVPESGEKVHGGIKEETRQTLINLSAVLEAAGSSLDKALLITVYMTDMEDFAQMNEVYASFFDGPCPARAAVGIRSLAKDACVEMQAIAAAV